jgi:hypothetical protein
MIHLPFHQYTSLGVFETGSRPKRRAESMVRAILEGWSLPSRARKLPLATQNSIPTSSPRLRY